MSEFKCPKCGYEGTNWEFTPNRFKSEKYCPRCSELQTGTESEGEVERE